MRRQLHRDVRPLPGLGARRNWSATVATSGCKAREAPRPFAMGRPGDDATADEPIAPPLPRDRARAPRCSFRRNARPGALEGLAAVEQVLEHSTRSGDWRGLRRGRDRNRARRRATRVPRTLDNDHRRCAPAGHPGAHPPRPAGARVDDFETRARGAVDSAGAKTALDDDDERLGACELQRAPSLYFVRQAHILRDQRRRPRRRLRDARARRRRLGRASRTPVVAAPALARMSANVGDSPRKLRQA